MLCRKEKQGKGGQGEVGEERKEDLRGREDKASKKRNRGTALNTGNLNYFVQLKNPFLASKCGRYTDGIYAVISALSYARIVTTRAIHHHRHHHHYHQSWAHRPFMLDASLIIL